MMKYTILKERSSLKEDAVSPVIGVMLMLVVTIIVAAFVAVFTGSAFGNTEISPSAALDVKLLSSGGSDPTSPQYVMLIEHLGGASIPTADMRIISYYTPPSTTGETMQTSQVTASTRAVTMSMNGENVQVKVPFLNDVSRGRPGSAGTNFGEFTLSSGDVISTGSSAGTRAVLGFDMTTAEGRAGFGFGRGSAVDVEIIHIPSQKSLYSGRVIVQ
jgi:hypothetical protein